MQKITQNQFMKLNVKHKIKKKKKSKKNLWGLGLGKAFLDLTPQGKSIKGKTDKLDFIKITNICPVKISLKG